MLKDFGVEWVIIGHSERRALYGDSDAICAEKVAAALKAGMSVIPCIGETLEERENGSMTDVLTRQLKAMGDVVQGAWDRVVLAYEPVWAIGTGVTASPEQAQEVHAMLRSWLAGVYGKEVADKLRIIYGGSVKPSNAVSLIAKPDIDGFLVGGASLKSKDFGPIVDAAAQHARAKL
jgi:triosephosphate isomerase